MTLLPLYCVFTSFQIDLAREASNLQRFNFNFRRTDHVRFPMPIYPLVSSDVLVGPTSLGYRAIRAVGLS